MKLGLDQEGLLALCVSKVLHDECFTVAEVFVTLWYGTDTLFARVVGCRGYDRIWMEGVLEPWIQMGPEEGDKLLPQDEREDSFN